MITVKTKTKRGFTLIEMLVAVALFTVAMTIAIGAMLSLLDANKKEQALKSSVNNLNFAIESISREIRTGVNYNCGSNPVSGTTRNCTAGYSWIGFTSSSGDFLQYKKTGSSIERSINGSSFVPMTAPEINIDTFTFYTFGSTRGQAEGIQPRVTIVVSGTAGIKEKIKTDFNIQTTVSQRLPDF